MARAMKITWNRSSGIDSVSTFITEKNPQMIETVELGVSECYIQRLVTFSAYSVYYFIVTSISLIFVMFYYNLLDLMYSVLIHECSRLRYKDELTMLKPAVPVCHIFFGFLFFAAASFICTHKTENRDVNCNMWCDKKCD